MANLGPGAFRLQIPESGLQVEGRFEAGQEPLVLEALRDHRSARLRVKGTAEFATRDRQIKWILSVDEVALAPTETDTFDESATPIWEQLAAIGVEAPPGTWEAVPSDLSRAAFDNYRTAADKEWSLTDCSSFVLMRERDVSEALAHDHHFEQAGFVALLR